MNHFALLRNCVSFESQIFGRSLRNLGLVNRFVAPGNRAFLGSLSGKFISAKSFNYAERRSGLQTLASAGQLRPFSTKSLLFSKEENAKKEETDKPISQRQKLTRIFAAYGSTAVVFHTSISLTSLGICYMIVSSGIDMVAILEKIGIASEEGLQKTFATGASTFVVAYACHKVFMPVRIFLTVTCTPVIVNKLRSMGILKAKVASQKA